KLSVTHLIWAASLLITLIHFWWWEFALFTVLSWNFGDFLFLIAYCIALFLLCVLLFPDDIKEYDGYEDFFLSRRAWFFGLLALTIVFDIFARAPNGPPHFTAFPLEYTIQVPLGLLFCGIAVFTSNRPYHLTIALLQVAYQLSWIVRL